MIKDYPVYPIGDGIIEINEFGGPSMFLVEGSDKCLLIDTGIGIGDLKGFIKAYTDKPLLVFLTHNHRDHVGNAPLFKSVMMNKKDWKIGPIVRDWTSKNSRLKFAHAVCLDSKWTDEDIFSFLPSDEPEIIFIDDGYTVDLGGRWIDFYLCPGHTAGSMVAIDRNTRTLFAGDSCNNVLGICLRKYPGVEMVSIETALSGLERIWNLDFDKNRIFNAHPDFRTPGKPLPSDIYEKIIDGLRHILQGDYVCRRRIIKNINTDVDYAVFSDVEIQFHSLMIKDKDLGTI